METDMSPDNHEALRYAIKKPEATSLSLQLLGPFWILVGRFFRGKWLTYI